MEQAVRILMCGSRGWTDQGTIHRVVAYYEKWARFIGEPLTIVHGDAAGADRIADRAAQERRIRVERWPAEWEKYGKAAGPIRSRLMLESNITAGVAFWDGQSSGTAYTIRTAHEKHIPVTVITGRWPPNGSRP